MRLLLVDDDTIFAATLARALERHGHRTIIARDPDSALAALAAGEAFEGAIVDLRLGAHSGLALIAPLAERAPGLRILVLTGYASIATAITAIKQGATNYLPKPATAAQILAALAADADDAQPPPERADPTSLRRLEWEHIQQVLAAHEGNISATARALGMHRRTLQRKLAKKPGRE